VQDLQREAENRRLVAGARRSWTTADLRSLFSRIGAALSRRSRIQPQAAESAERWQEIA
jgi:hypothetical protein